MIVNIDNKIKFRPQMSLCRSRLESNFIEYDADKIRQCSSKIGHILYVESPGVIACHNCPAKWKDEGF